MKQSERLMRLINKLNVLDENAISDILTDAENIGNERRAKELEQLSNYQPKHALIAGFKKGLTSIFTGLFTPPAAMGSARYGMPIVNNELIGSTKKSGHEQDWANVENSLSQALSNYLKTHPEIYARLSEQEKTMADAAISPMSATTAEKATLSL